MPMVWLEARKNTRVNNWTLCAREAEIMLRFLEPKELDPPGVDVIKRGKAAEALVAFKHPGWTAQVTLSLPWGRRCRPDFLDEGGAPVEVKSTAKEVESWRDFMTGYYYQQQYVCQLSAYCHLTGKPGRFILVNPETQGMSEFPMTLIEAEEVWAKFTAGEIRPNSCRYCKTKQACLVLNRVGILKGDLYDEAGS